MGKMGEQCSTILSETEPKYSLALAFFLVELNFIIDFNKQLSLEAFDHVDDLLDELFLLNDDLSF